MKISYITNKNSLYLKARFILYHWFIHNWIFVYKLLSYKISPFITATCHLHSLCSIIKRNSIFCLTLAFSVSSQIPWYHQNVIIKMHLRRCMLCCMSVQSVVSVLPDTGHMNIHISPGCRLQFSNKVKTETCLYY